MSDVYVIGVGLHPFGKYPQSSLHQLTGVAVRAATRDAGVRLQEIDSVHFGNAYAGITTGQESVRGQVALRESGIADVPIVNIDNACASSSTALNQAVIGIEAGRSEISLVVGAEKLHLNDTAKSISAIATAADVTYMPLLGMQFTGLYAMKAQEYMRMHGATKVHAAMVAAKNSYNGFLNPNAQFRKIRSVKEIVDSRVISGVLTLFMCSSIADGASAVVLASGEYVRSRHIQGAVKIDASVLRSGSFDANRDPAVPSSVARAARDAYAMAGMGPEDVAFAEVHDAAATIEFEHMEDLGLCEPGEAYKLVEAGETGIHGRIPINTSGGLIARGHPAGATGLAQVAEVVSQLRGTAGPRQVTFNGSRIGMALNTGGRVGSDRAAIVVHILSRNGEVR